MTQKILFSVATSWLFKALGVALVMMSNAYASPPKESIKCTDAPRTAWVGESKIRQAFDEGKYLKVIFKTSRGNCYEFYAIGKDGSIVEAYYDPVTMDLVRFNRVARGGGFEGSALPVQAVSKGNIVRN